MDVVTQITLSMNALKYTTLTATCMHNSCMCNVYSIIPRYNNDNIIKIVHCVSLFNVRSMNYIPCTRTGSATEFSSESVHDLGVGGRHLAISLYKTSVMYIPS